MWVYDAATIRFLAVNEAATEKYGYTASEFLAMTLRDIRPSEDIPRLLESTSKPTTRLNTEGPWRHRKKDDSIIMVEIVEQPISFVGHDACLVMASDITERERLAQQLRQAQRLESIGRLAGGVAHDFNNMLTVINGYSEMLLTDAAANSPTREQLAEIRAAGERASSLTQQLLAFSRKQIIQPTILNLNDVVADIEKMLRRLIGEDIEMVTTLDPALGNVKADASQIQQIIMNLAVNARDAMPGGGRLLIETANSTFDASYIPTHPEVRGGDYAMLAVTDNGTGMTAEVKQHLFEPFFTTKEHGKGTGLGLATVYGMVKQSGGWIWVYSEPGCGTTLKIYLPRTGQPATEAVVKLDERRTGKRSHSGSGGSERGADSGCGGPAEIWIPGLRSLQRRRGACLLPAIRRIA